MTQVPRNLGLYGLEEVLKQQLPPVTVEECEELRTSEVQQSLQPDINIGMIGHVAHGKTSLTRAISGIITTKFSEEKRRNLTIKLGYANFKIFQCTNMLCPPPICFQSFGSKETSPKCSECGSAMKLVRHMSFVDCPGHEMLMRTMLNGAAVMDAAVLVVAANQEVPQPQTAEHLVVAEIMGLSRILTVQNKCDLISPSAAAKSKEAIDRFVEGSIAEHSPIIPMSCAPNFRCNVDVLLQYFVEKIPLPVRDLISPPLMRVIRSFDINKPGAKISALRGGVVGGSLERGVLRIGEIVEIRPGIVRTDPKTGRKSATPLFSKVVSLFSESNPLKQAIPGGLIAVGLTLDPCLSGKDRLVGQVMGRANELPPIFQSLEVKYNLMKRVVGDVKEEKVTRPVVGELLSLTIGSACVEGEVIESEKGKAKIKLNLPACSEIGDRVSLSRKVNKRYRLVGWGKITAGKPLLI